MPNPLQKVVVLGGAGYVGAALVPFLLERGFQVRVIDLYIYGDDVLDGSKENPNFSEVKCDLRDVAAVKKAMLGYDSLIHLACISNDPSFDLDPVLGKAINFDAFEPVVVAAKEVGIRRFVFASSSSVYGVKDVRDVTEAMSLDPLTDYAKYKMMCEEVLFRYTSPDFTTVAVRPSTVCGYSPRQRLDIVVNIFTNHAVNLGTIKVIGGNLKRPSIHIQDMIELYDVLLRASSDSISGQVFNAGYANHDLQTLAEIVRTVVGREKTRIEQSATSDHRSYHISSEKLQRELGFAARFTIEDAVCGLVDAFGKGLLPNSLSDSRYFNIQRMKEIGLR
jgi:nucleoside-diphosphate-sugar epimerase